jgi:hypothetical protein
MKKFHWSQEVYSLGYLYRSAYRYPRFLPLFITTEHGVNFSPEFDEAIKRIKFRGLVFFTWNESSIHKHKKSKTPKFLEQIHPWIIYKEKHKLKIDDHRKGTVYFPFHTVPGIRSEGENDEESIKFLLSSNLSQPITICLHWNDYHSERKAYFEACGFDVTYVGHPNSPDFMRNFFDLVRDKRNAVVEGWSTAVSLLIDLGIPTLVLHRQVIEYGTEDPDDVRGYPNPEFRLGYEKACNLFYEHLSTPTLDQVRYVQNLLGYQYRKNTKRNLLMIWVSLFVVGPQWIFVEIIKNISFFVKRCRRVAGRFLRREPLRSNPRIKKV